MKTRERKLKPMNEFGIGVKAFLARNGMSAVELAAIAEVKRSTLHEAMVGRTEGYELKPKVRKTMQEWEAAH